MNNAQTENLYLWLYEMLAKAAFKTTRPAILNTYEDHEKTDQYNDGYANAIRDVIEKLDDERTSNKTAIVARAPDGTPICDVIFLSENPINLEKIITALNRQLPL